MRLISKVVDSKSTQNSSTYSVTKKSYSFTKSASSSKFPQTPSGNWDPRQLKRSQSITELLESNRCFKPSDTTDPGKKAFLTNLTKKVFKVGLVSYLRRSKITS